MFEFKIPEMTCGHCVRAVTQAVQAVDPLAQVQVDLPSQTLKVDSSAPRQALVQALQEADYPPA